MGLLVTLGRHLWPFSPLLPFPTSPCYPNGMVGECGNSCQHDLFPCLLEVALSETLHMSPYMSACFKPSPFQSTLSTYLAAVPHRRLKSNFYPYTHRIYMLKFHLSRIGHCRQTLCCCTSKDNGQSSEFSSAYF